MTWQEQRCTFRYRLHIAQKKHQFTEGSKKMILKLQSMCTHFFTRRLMATYLE